MHGFVLYGMKLVLHPQLHSTVSGNVHLSFLICFQMHVVIGCTHELEYETSTQGHENTRGSRCEVIVQ